MIRDDFVRRDMGGYADLLMAMLRGSNVICHCCIQKPINTYQPGRNQPLPIQFLAALFCYQIQSPQLQDTLPQCLSNLRRLVEFRLQILLRPSGVLEGIRNRLLHGRILCAGRALCFVEFGGPRGGVSHEVEVESDENFPITFKNVSGAGLQKFCHLGVVGIGL